jgi:hypothetical protein
MTACRNLILSPGMRGDRRGPRANGWSQTGMEINIAQFLLKFTQNECYRVAGVVSCVFHKSPCVPVIRGDHVPVPIARCLSLTAHMQFLGIHISSFMRKRYSRWSGKVVARAARYPLSYNTAVKSDVRSHIIPRLRPWHIYTDPRFLAVATCHADGFWKESIGSLSLSTSE